MSATRIAATAVALAVLAACESISKSAAAIDQKERAAVSGLGADLQDPHGVAARDLEAARRAFEEARARAAAIDDPRSSAHGDGDAHGDHASPDSPAADLARGRTDELAGRWEQALEAYASARRKDPAQHAPAISAARALHALGRHAEAAELLASAASAAPNAADLERAAGEAYLAAGDASKALAFLRQARAFDPSDRTTLEFLAVALFQLQKFAEVVTLLEKQSPETLSDHVCLIAGRSALLTVHAETASALLERSAHVFSQDPDVWLDLARARVLANRLSEARAACETALAMVPRSPQALLLLGHVHKLAGRAREAGACYAQALREGADPVLLAPLIEALVPIGADAPRSDDECPDDPPRRSPTDRAAGERSQRPEHGERLERSERNGG
jgi:tetratricopeptide (TPR) repeat protein